MKGFHFYADLSGTLVQPEQHDNRFADDKPVFSKRTTRAQLRKAAARGEHCNVVAVLIGDEYQYTDGRTRMQEALVATFGHANSDTSGSSVSLEYLRGCRRIDEALARKLHPRLFVRLDADE